MTRCVCVCVAAAKIAGVYSDSDPPRKTMRRGVLMTLLQQSAMTLPLWIGKPGDRYTQTASLEAVTDSQTDTDVGPDRQTARRQVHAAKRTQTSGQLILLLAVNKSPSHWRIT